MTNTKQLKIPKLFRRQGAKVPEDCEELQEEIRELEQRLKEKQDELFNAQRCALKRKVTPLSQNKKNNETIIRPERLLLNNDVHHLEKSMELMTMLSGTEVKSYAANDHCVVKYHMQHPAPHEIKHGLRITMKSGTNVVSKFSLPLGFNFNAVVEEYDNIMTPECLGAVRKGLVAYYDRQLQYNDLKRLLSLKAQLFKTMDGSHMELTFRVEADDEEPLTVVMQLEYRVYDIRPKTYSFSEIDLPDGVADILHAQCAAFKRKPLDVAFRLCFIEGEGTFKFGQQTRPRRERRRKRGRKHHHHHNDFTFRPEDCSSEDEDERDLRQVYGRRC